jgi:hypothetical protein
MSDLGLVARAGCCLALAALALGLAGCECPSDPYAVESWFRWCGSGGALCGWSAAGPGTARLGPSRVHPGIEALAIDGEVELTWSAAAAPDADDRVWTPGWTRRPWLAVLGDCEEVDATVTLVVVRPPGLPGDPSADAGPAPPEVVSADLTLRLDRGRTGSSIVRTLAADLPLPSEAETYELHTIRLRFHGGRCLVHGVRVVRQPLAGECLG